MIVPGMTADLVEPVTEIYQEAELRILRTISTSLAEGLDAPDWEVRQLARVQDVRERLTRELNDVNPLAAAEVRRTLDSAYSLGQASAYRDAHKALDPLQAVTSARAAAVARLAADTGKGLDSFLPGILRRVDDVYRSVVAEVTGSVLAGAEGRREATQRAISSWLSKGITGVATARGQMDLPTYATMAVRTATARAAISGHVDTAGDLGLDLVVIHPGPRACKICDDWARAILSTTGETGTLRRNDAATGKSIEVKVSASLDDARRAGWGHPNCRCGCASFIPGVTSTKTIERPPWDQEGYQAQQQQRAIERQIRGWKQADALAITPAAKADAKAKIAAWQKAQREHMAANPDLKRQSSREQIGGLHSGRSPREAGAERIKPDPKTPEPPSATPKLDKFTRLTMPEAYADAAKPRTVNPGYGDSAGRYDVNCTYVVSAVEMRARGLDVIARPLPGKRAGRSLVEISSEWTAPEGGARQFSPIRGGQVSLERQIQESWPDGARGIIHIDWKGGAAHVFNVERRDGKVLYHEGQIPDVDAAGYFADRHPGRPMWILRTDDLDMTDALADVVYPGDGPAAARIVEAVANREAAAAAAEVARKAEIDRQRGEREAARQTPEGQIREAENEVDLARRIIGNLLDAGRDWDDDAVQRYVSRQADAERKLNELRRARWD